VDTFYFDYAVRFAAAAGSSISPIVLGILGGAEFQAEGAVYNTRELVRFFLTFELHVLDSLHRHSSARSPAYFKPSIFAGKTIAHR
jgi:hypothetical protein